MTGQDDVRSFFRQVFGDAWIAQALSVAAELGLADEVAAGPQSAAELARRTGADAGSLHRMLRALASAGVFSEDAEGRFAMTPLAAPLQAGIPGSQKAMAAMMGAEFHDAWGGLLHSVRTGRPGFDARFGAPFFEYMTAHPERHGVYDDAMTSVHGHETGAVLDAVDFSRFRTVVDVGGGNGSALAEILRRHPSARGVLFDLPAVADRAAAALGRAGLAGRFDVVRGDFFAAVPPGADACVLRHVLHDWQDPEAVAILRNCRRAMGPGSRLLVVESVLPPGNAPSFGKWLDLMMLLVGGRERTAEEFRRIFDQAGLRLERIVPTAAEVCVIEGTAAS